MVSPAPPLSVVESREPFLPGKVEVLREDASQLILRFAGSLVSVNRKANQVRVNRLPIVSSESFSHVELVQHLVGEEGAQAWSIFLRSSPTERIRVGTVSESVIASIAGARLGTYLAKPVRCSS